jgi:hypothetical protein
MRAAVHDEVAAGTLVAIPLEKPSLQRRLFAVLPVDAPERSAARRFLAMTM